MVEKIRENIYRIGVGLPNNPLRELNSYLIRGDESDLLIDTGFRMDECRRDLQAGIGEIGSNIDRLDVLTTHFHSDHSGLVLEFAGKDRRIYMSERDYTSIKNELNNTGVNERRVRCQQEGFSEELLDLIDQTNPVIHYRMPRVDERFVPVNEGDEIRVGDFTLKVIATPGHTAGNIMLWIESAGLMQWRIRARNWDEFPPVQKWFAVGACLSHLDYLMKRGMVRREMVDGTWKYYRIG